MASKGHHLSGINPSDNTHTVGRVLRLKGRKGEQRRRHSNGQKHSETRGACREPADSRKQEGGNPHNLTVDREAHAQKTSIPRSGGGEADRSWKRPALAFVFGDEEGTEN